MNFVQKTEKVPLCIKYLVLKFEPDWSNIMHVADVFVTVVMVIFIMMPPDDSVVL